MLRFPFCSAPRQFFAPLSLCVLTLCVLTLWLSFPTLAQNSATSNSTTPPATSAPTTASPAAVEPPAVESAATGSAEKFKARKVGSALIYLPETVDAAKLERLRNQTIEVRGIISSFTGIKQRYRFTTDDGAAILVIGDFPSQGGVTYYLRGRVVQDGDKLALAEVAKQLEPFGTAAKTQGLLDGPNAPLIIGGGVLLLAALGTLGALMMRGKTAERERVLQAQIEKERAKAEIEKARLKPAVPAVNAGAGRGQTVIAGGAGAAGMGHAAREAGKAPQHTIASRGTIRIQGGPHTGETFPLVDGETRIGRKAEDSCLVVLSKDSAVSSYHASIVVTRDGRLVFEDCSSNGSVVDDVFVQRAQRDISSGANIKIGASTLLVELFAAPTAPVHSATPSAAPIPAPAISTAPSIPSAPAIPATNGARRDAPTVSVEGAMVQAALSGAPLAGAPQRAAATSLGYGAEFEVLSGPEQGRRFPVTRATTTIGREHRDILLSESSISRQHATLAARDGSFYLSDNGSAHGTRLGAERIGAEDRELRNGDEITFGTQTTLKFHCIKAR